MCGQRERERSAFAEASADRLVPRHPRQAPMLALPETMTAEQVMALVRIADILGGVDKDRRIAELVAANNALLERARVAEAALRDGDHAALYADLDRCTSLADDDLTGGGVQRLAATIARLRARVTELEGKLSALSCQLSVG